MEVEPKSKFQVGLIGFGECTCVYPSSRIRAVRLGDCKTRLSLHVLRLAYLETDRGRRREPKLAEKLDCF